MLHPATVERVLLAALSYGGDFAEVFVENKIEQNISMVKGEVEKHAPDKISASVYAFFMEAITSTRIPATKTKNTSLKPPAFSPRQLKKRA